MRREALHNRGIKWRQIKSFSVKNQSTRLTCFSPFYSQIFSVADATIKYSVLSKKRRKYIIITCA